MNRLQNGINSFGISVSAELTGIAEVRLELYSVNGVDMFEVWAVVSDFDCFTGATILSVLLEDFDDGDYYIIAYDGDDLIWQGLTYVYSYELISGDNGIVIGQPIEIENYYLLEDGTLALLEDDTPQELEG